MDDERESAKTFFARIRDLKKDMFTAKRRRAKYMAIATRMSGMSETNIRSSNGRSRVESGAIDLINVADDIGALLKQYAAQVRRAEKIIAQIKSARHRTVLSLRYLEGLGWRTVNDIMGYTGDKSAEQVHGWALLAAQKVMNNMP